jgi:hypothetical protein
MPMPLTFELVVEALRAARWTFAKTGRAPHWYAETAPFGPPPYDDVVRWIRDHGYWERHSGGTHATIDLDGYRVWAADDRTIRKAKIEEHSSYDDIASTYDEAWQTPEALAENARVMDAIAYVGGNVLDIGCGSGLFLDYIKPEDYVGLDPSRAMLARLLARHPCRTVWCARFEDFNPGQRHFDLIVSLFGSPSYILPESLARVPAMLTPGGRYFLMLFRPSYTPLTHSLLGVSPITYPLEHYDMLPGRRSNMGNFVVLDGPLKE